MSDLVRYERIDTVATITMDDGKVNALSPAMFTGLNEAFDQADSDGTAVVLAGRPGRFSAGFDLSVLTGGGEAAADLLKSGFELTERMLSFPAPVVVACTGHAIAMGVFVLLAGDYRVGAAGSFKIQANEVAIGMTMPRAALEMCRQRLTPAAYNRAVILAEAFAPETAIAAGFLDEIVPPDAVLAAAVRLATSHAALDRRAHAASKLRAREQSLQALHEAIAIDDAEFRALIGR